METTLAVSQTQNVTGANLKGDYSVCQLMYSYPYIHIMQTEFVCTVQFVSNPLYTHTEKNKTMILNKGFIERKPGWLIDWLTAQHLTLALNFNKVDSSFVLTEERSTRLFSRLCGNSSSDVYQNKTLQRKCLCEQLCVVSRRNKLSMSISSAAGSTYILLTCVLKEFKQQTLWYNTM